MNKVFIYSGNTIAGSTRRLAQMNDDGLISKLTTTYGTSVTTITYQYHCN